MAVQLPLAFLNRMQSLLGEEYDSFLSSYDNPKHVGIRVNTLKIDVDEFLKISPFELKPIPWCSTGFYVDESEKPGKHPYYHAGLYYIQEPSAMSPAEALNAVPGDRVLDLCAAPGGKSTQIGAKLQGKGLLVTNDISADRTKALAKNIELYGVRNAVVLNETPERIAKSFPHYFNKIIIDAPCSGEGMFRKDEDMIRQWDKHSVAKCTMMQRDILKTAASLLSPGGTIVYSTCTFAPEENEGMIAEFLQNNAEFEIVPLPADSGFSPGRPDWIADAAGEVTIPDSVKAQTAGCGRLWPHKIEGEGHFLAILRHTGDIVKALDIDKNTASGMASDPSEGFSDQRFDKREHPRGTGISGKHNSSRSNSDNGRRHGSEHSRENSNQHAKQHTNRHTKQHSKQHSKELSREHGRGHSKQGNKGLNEQEMLDNWSAFASEQLAIQAGEQPLFFGGNAYLSPLNKDRLNGLKTVRPGWYVGTSKNGRFQPGHPLATALNPNEAARVLELLSREAETVRYLKGETLEIPESRIIRQAGVSPKGYVLVTVDGYSLGWGKWLDGMLKNEYPAGWRWT